MNKPTLAELAEILEKLYPKSLALDWDVVGLATGETKETVNKVLLTVDVTKEVVQEAIELSANLIISHHPLSLDLEEENDVKEINDELISILEINSIALFAIHTNADIATGGVNESLAKALGLNEIKPFGIEKMGRIGKSSQEISLKEIVLKVQDILPNVKSSIQVSGNISEKIKIVAVCGGSGASLLEEVRKTDADVFITADLKHHAVSDNKSMNGPFLISVSHWASEWMWLPELRNQLHNELNKISKELEIKVSEIATDPWDYSLGSGL